MSGRIFIFVYTYTKHNVLRYRVEAHRQSSFAFINMSTIYHKGKVPNSCMLMYANTPRLDFMRHNILAVSHGHLTSS